MEQFILTQIDVNDLKTQIADEVISRLSATTRTPPQEQDDLLTEAEAMEYLSIKSKATMWRLRNRGKLKGIGLGGKRYYRKSDIDASLITIKKG